MTHNRVTHILIWLVNFVIYLGILLLSLRFILRLFGANDRAPFVNWVYDTSIELLAPFRGIFPSPVVEGGFVFEITTLFAIVIYAILGWIIIEVIEMIAAAGSSRHRGNPPGQY